MFFLARLLSGRQLNVPRYNACYDFLVNERRLFAKTFHSVLGSTF